jgi:hypothetical protein
MKRIHHKLFVIAFFALLCLAATSAIALSARAASAPPTPPQWLMERVNSDIAAYTGDQTLSTAVTSASWTKTTWGQLEQAVGGTGDPDCSAKEAFVVVFYGTFTVDSPAPVTATNPNPAPITGTVLVLTYDAATQALSEVDVLYSHSGISTATLGAATPLSLAE